MMGQPSGKTRAPHWNESVMRVSVRTPGSRSSSALHPAAPEVSFATVYNAGAISLTGEIAISSVAGS